MICREYAIYSRSSSRVSNIVFVTRNEFLIMHAISSLCDSRAGAVWQRSSPTLVVLACCAAAPPHRRLVQDFCSQTARQDTGRAIVTIIESLGVAATLARTSDRHLMTHRSDTRRCSNFTFGSRCFRLGARP
jgi:hypothetical protein